MLLLIKKVSGNSGNFFLLNFENFLKLNKNGKKRTFRNTLKIEKLFFFDNIYQTRKFVVF